MHEDGVVGKRAREMVIPEHCNVASNAAAKQAVKEVFGKLGVDVDDPHSVREFVEDLRFGGRMRKYADRGMVVLITVITGAAVMAMWEGLVAQLKKVVS